MNAKEKLRIAALAAVALVLIAPAFAQDSAPQRMPDQGMRMHRMGQGMMRGGMMSRETMAGCSEMMQSMNDDGGQPNSQWQKHPPQNPGGGG
jgi:hypothetical protein